MSDPAASGWEARIAAVYVADRRRILATLVRLLGDFDLAEEALHDAFAAAVEQWPVRGMPETPWTWLVSAGRFRTIDRLRRKARCDAHAAELVMRIEGDAEDAANAVGQEPQDMPDDTLRLIFTCCHPALAPDGQVALTLREVCGLTTEAIAEAFLTATPTIAQRIVRAKARIRDAQLPYEVPERAALPERLETVLRVVYLVFNAGYSVAPAAPGASLAAEAIRLGRLVVELVPDPEALGLLALMLLQHSRRAARLDAAGEVVLLPDQDRVRWDRAEIAEGLQLLTQSWQSREIGGYVLQAAIAAEHARAPTAAATDWARIVSLYDLLQQADPSPVVELNRAVAIGQRDGPAAGLEALARLERDPSLSAYPWLSAARADALRRLGRADEALTAYRAARELARDPADRRHFERQIAALSD